MKENSFFSLPYLWLDYNLTTQPEEGAAYGPTIPAAGQEPNCDTTSTCFPLAPGRKYVAPAPLVAQLISPSVMAHLCCSGELKLCQVLTHSQSTWAVHQQLLSTTVLSLAKLVVHTGKYALHGHEAGLTTEPLECQLPTKYIHIKYQ